MAAALVPIVTAAAVAAAGPTFPSGRGGGAGSAIAGPAGAASAGSLPVLGQVGGAPHDIALEGERLVLATGLRLDVLASGDGGAWRDVGRSARLDRPADRVVVADGRIYALQLASFGGGGTSAVAILRLADDGPPVPIGTLDLGESYGVALAVEAGTLYAATRPDRLDAFDVADGSHPRALGSVAVPDGIMSIAVAGPVVSVATLEGVDLVDATAPEAMRRVAHIDVPGGFGPAPMAMTGGLLFVGVPGQDVATPLRVQVYDTATPSAPVLRSTIETRFTNHAFLAGSASTLLVGGQRQDDTTRHTVDAFDVRRPEAPARVGDGLAVPEIWQLVRSGRRAAVRTDTSVEVIDVDDAGWPHAAGATAEFERTHDVFPLAADELVTATESGPYRAEAPYARVHDVTDPAVPVQRTDLPAALPLAGVAAVGAVAVALGGGEACRLDAFTGTPGARVALDSIPLEGTCGPLARDGARLFAAAGSAVTIVDAADDGRLTRVGRIPVAGEVWHLAAAGGLVWIAHLAPGDFGAGRRTLDAFDATDPAAPRRIGAVTLSSSMAPAIQAATEIVARGRFAWVAESGHLRTLEGTADGSLVDHTALVVPGGDGELTLDGDLLVLRYRPRETAWHLAVFDVRSPAAPRQVVDVADRDLPFRDGGALAALDGRLYVTSPGGVMILDLASLAPPPASPPPAYLPIALGR